MEILIILFLGVVFFAIGASQLQKSADTWKDINKLRAEIKKAKQK